MEDKPELRRKYRELLQDIPKFIKDTTGSTGGRSYKYLKLSTLLTDIKPMLEQHELSISQSIEYVADGGVQIYNRPSDRKNGSPSEQPLFLAVVITRIFDDSGQIEVGRYPVAMSADAQSNGSGVTYARRYSLFAALGIYPDKDDDGAATRQEQDPQEQVPNDGISKEDANKLLALAKEHGANLLAVASKVKGRKVTRLRQISVSEIGAIVEMITKKNGGLNETA